MSQILASFPLGTGPKAVILLHGFLGSGRNLLSVARKWHERDATRRFVLMDLTGHGNSPPLKGEPGLFELAEDVLATARDLHLPQPFTLVGHSLGGRVALAASLFAPGAITGVGLLDIAPGPIDRVGGETAAVVAALRAAPAELPDREAARDHFLKSGLSRPLTEWILTNLVAKDGGGYRWRFDRQALFDLHPRVNAGDLWGAVERPGTNVRCVRGGRSRYVSDDDTLRLESAGCRVVTLPEAGHFVHVDALDAVVDAIVDL